MYNNVFIEVFWDSLDTSRHRSIANDVGDELAVIELPGRTSISQALLHLITLENEKTLHQINDITGVLLYLTGTFQVFVHDIIVHPHEHIATHSPLTRYNT